jgi:hypothetical protein
MQRQQQQQQQQQGLPGGPVRPGALLASEVTQEGLAAEALVCYVTGKGLGMLTGDLMVQCFATRVLGFLI